MRLRMLTAKTPIRALVRVPRKARIIFLRRKIKKRKHLLINSKPLSKLKLTPKQQR